jgi:hypothetical protein
MVERTLTEKKTFEETMFWSQVAKTRRELFRSKLDRGIKLDEKDVLTATVIAALMVIDTTSEKLGEEGMDSKLGDWLHDRRSEIIDSPYLRKDKAV